MPKNHDFQKVALAVKASVSSGAVFVHPLSDRTQLTSVTAAKLSGDKAAYECSHCKTTVVASVGAAPHCVVCSHETKPVKASVKISPPKNLEDFTAVECKHCKTVSVMETKAVVASAFHIHCPACGCHNDFSKSVTASDQGTPESEMTTPSEKPLEIGNNDNVVVRSEKEPELETPIASATDWPFADEKSAEQADADEMPAVQPDEDLDSEPAEEVKSSREPALQAEDSSEEIESDAMGDDADIEIEDLDDFNPDIDEKASVDGEEEIPAEEIQAGHSSLSALPTPAPAGSSNYSLDLDAPVQCAAEEENVIKMTESDQGDTLADAMEMDDTQAGLSFEAKAGRVVAMKGHVAIASLTEENAGKNADIMRTRGFQNALVAMAQQSGLRRTLISAGFKMIKIPVVSKATVDRRVKEAIQASNAAKTQELAVLSECMALAAAGLSRGQWRGKENPLLAAFAAELKTAGVRNPERVVSRVLSDNVVPFTRSLMEIASDLSKLSERSRAETAAVLEMTTPTAIVSSSEDPEVNEDDLETRLNTTAAIVRASVTPTTRSQRQDVTAATVQDTASRILSGDLPLMLGN